MKESTPSGVREISVRFWTTSRSELQQTLEFYNKSSLAQHWARDWLALALTQVHHGSRLSDSCEGGEALSSLARNPIPIIRPAGCAS